MSSLLFAVTDGFDVGLARAGRGPAEPIAWHRGLDAWIDRALSTVRCFADPAAALVARMVPCPESLIPMLLEVGQGDGWSDSPELQPLRNAAAHALPIEYLDGQAWRHVGAVLATGRDVWVWGVPQGVDGWPTSGVPGGL